MRSFYAVLVVFAILIAFGFSAYYYIDNTARSLAVRTETVEQSARNRDWKQAKQNFDALHAAWNRTSARWTVLIDHQELDNINITMSRAREFMNAGDISGVMSELAELKLLFRHIPEKEGLTLKNIL